MLRTLMNDENGQGMAEYGLILALIAVVAIIAITALGGNIRDKFQEVADGLTSAG